MGAKVRVCGPSTLLPRFLTSLDVEVSYDLQESIKWCDVANILRIQLERQKLNFFPSNREYAMLFGLNKDVLKNINNDILLMHPGPINRGVEVTTDVIDSNQSIVLDQVENGVAIRMAVLYLLAAKLKKK